MVRSVRVGGWVGGKGIEIELTSLRTPKKECFEQFIQSPFSTLTYISISVDDSNQPSPILRPGTSIYAHHPFSMTSRCKIPCNHPLRIRLDIKIPSRCMIIPCRVHQLHKPTKKTPERMRQRPPLSYSSHPVPSQKGVYACHMPPGACSRECCWYI